MSFRKFAKEMERKREEDQILNMLKTSVKTWEDRKHKYAEEAKDILKKGNEDHLNMQLALLKNAMCQLAQAEDMLLNFIAVKDMHDMQMLSAKFIKSRDTVLRSIYKLSKRTNFKKANDKFKKATFAQSKVCLDLRDLLKDNDKTFADSVSKVSNIDNESILHILASDIEREDKVFGDTLSALEAELNLTEYVVNNTETRREDQIGCEENILSCISGYEQLGKEVALADYDSQDNAVNLETPGYFEWKENLYELPSLSLLKDNENYWSDKEASDNTNEIAQTIENKLRDFGIVAKAENCVKGPTFTRIELRPAADVAISRINSIKDDLAMVLKRKVRLLLPIEGKDLIGVEVANARREKVLLKQIIENAPTHNALTEHVEICLGVDINSQARYCKCNTLPHMLIGGTTGSGKSCFLHSVIVDLLYRYTPAQIRLMLIDFKRVELNIYNGIPHMLGKQAIDEYEDAIEALTLLNEEMERRYSAFVEVRVRDITEYNRCTSKKLPEIIVIIDEYADITNSPYSKEIEKLIQRIAQKSRACGIYMIVSTQKPSVKVINGIVKANFPSRAAFAVASFSDSINIIDSVGAENLLGEGDMLFVTNGKTERLQSAYVSTDEIAEVVKAIR